MPRYQVTVISPVHISSGKQFEQNYNLLQKDDAVYIYDEFSIGEFLLKNNLGVPYSLDQLKQKMRQYKDKIISSGIHLRKIKSDLCIDDGKVLFENVCSQNKPIVTGSSIKGAIRTAVINSLKDKSEKSKKILEKMSNQKIDRSRFENEKGKNIEAFDKDFANIFRYLKVSDSIGELETKVYKSINIKKNKEHQKNRKDKVRELENFVECIEPTQSFELIINDTSDDNIFENLGTICNSTSIPNYKIDSALYFKGPSKITQATANKLKSLSNKVFLLNVGKFGGAEQKSINGLRDIRMVREADKTKTTTRTFGIDKAPKDDTFFEKELFPFGWLLCELID